MPRYTFTYPSVLDAGSSMYDHLMEVMEANQVDPQLSQRCMLVISEAFTNAYLHGNKKIPEKRIIVNLTINSDWVSADIIDEGSGEWQKARNITTGTAILPDSNAENGRGIALMKHYAANIAFTEASGGGLKVTIRMKRGEQTKMENTK